MFLIRIAYQYYVFFFFMENIIWFGGEFRQGSVFCILHLNRPLPPLFLSKSILLSANKKFKIIVPYPVKSFCGAFLFYILLLF